MKRAWFIGTLTVGVLVSWSSVHAQDGNYVVTQRGVRIATEKYSRTADTLLSETQLVSGVAVIVEKARLELHSNSPITFDAEAAAGASMQRMHIDVAAENAKIRFVIAGFTKDTSVALARGVPVLLFQNFVFATLQPLADLRPAPGAGSRQIAVLNVQTAMLSMWSVESTSTNKTAITADGGLRIELVFSGQRLSEVHIPAQGVDVVTGAP
jgi:hypothetical protein